MKNVGYWSTILLIIALSGWYISPSSSVTIPDLSEKHKGVCWVGGHDTISIKELKPLLTCNITWISQTPFGWQANANTPDIKVNIPSDRVWWGESDSGISETTQMARKIGINTLLKPHLWIRNSWPGEVKMHSPSEWNEWFMNYSEFILHYAALAEANKVPILCIGTELQHTIIFESRWRELIKSIRKIYHGKLTYAANFNEEFKQVKFWDALDYIGLQAYFPLSETENPKVEELIANWADPLNSIEQIYLKYDRPVLFTEIGYRSTSDAAIEPWRWPQENTEAVISLQTQANCYEAFFKTAWKKSWLAGAYFWKWYSFGSGRLVEIDFTPQGKTAEKILADYFQE